MATELSYGVGMPRMGVVEEPNALWESSGLGESFRASRSSIGVGLGDAFHFSQANLAGAMRVPRASAASSV